MNPTSAIPAHLPKKLSICCWIWSWITFAAPDEPYEDLERCILELKDRGFNAIRMENGLNWAFKPDGSPRGPVTFGPWIAGYGWNFCTVNARGGATHDVLQRLFKLFELAEKHDIWLIPTNWEYQDSTWFLTDQKLRDEVFAIPKEERFMSLARLLNHLIDLLKERNLAHRIAYAEILNEPDCSEMPTGQESKKLHTDALDFLQKNHPDILFCADFTDPGRDNNYEIVPDNTQVFDFHVYGGAVWYFEDLYRNTVRHPEFDPHHPEKSEVLRRVLRKDIVPWDDFMKPAQNIRKAWRDVMWLYENLDNDRWDEWVRERFAIWEPRIRQRTIDLFAQDAREAKRRNLPQVFDEGGFFFPPGRSRFEISPEGLAILDLFADQAIRHNYWGFMPGTYCGPEHLIWNENPQWLRRINQRFCEAP